MNISSLSMEEVINYLESGVIGHLSSSDVLDILYKMEKKVDDLKVELQEKDTDYDSGWSDAVDEMREKLKWL